MRLFFRALSLICLLLISTNIFAAPEIKEKDAEKSAPAPLAAEIDVTSFWKNRQAELDRLLEDAREQQATLPKQTIALQKTLGSITSSYQQSAALIQYAKNKPEELTVIARQIQEQTELLHTTLAPLQVMVDSLQEKINELSVLEQDITELSTDASISLSSEVNRYLSTLTNAQKRLQALQKKIKAILNPGIALRKKLQDSRENIAKNLPVLWRDFYAAPADSLLDVNSWTAAPQSLVDFQSAITIRLVSSMPASAADWWSIIFRFMLFCGVATVLSLLVRRHHFFKQAAWQPIARYSIPLLLFGVACLFTATSAPGAFRFFFTLGNLLFIWGEVSLAWGLRRGEKEGLPLRSPLQNSMLMVLLSILLLLLDPSLPLLTHIWNCVLIWAIWKSFHATLPSLPFHFETAILHLNRIALIIATLMALSGWARLSMLFYASFIGVAASIQLGLGILRVVNEWEQSLPADGAKAMIGGVFIALAAPMVLLLVVFVSVFWLFSYPGGYFLVRSILDTDISIGSYSLNMLRIVFIISAFYLTRALIGISQNFIRDFPKRSQLDPSMVPQLQTVSTYLLWSLFTLYFLHSCGVDMTSLAVIAGGLSVGIGFGLQTLVNNFISGLILIFDRSLQEGDVVEVSGIMGIVRKINIRTTTVETYDNAVIIVPNSQFVSNSLTNWTRNSRSVRREIAIGVAYGSDPELVMSLLLQCAREHPRVLNVPTPMVLFNNFGNSTLDFLLRFWVGDVDHGGSTRSDLLVAINKVFGEHAIEIAFPQLDVHLRAQTAPAAITETAEREDAATPDTVASPAPATSKA